MNVGEGAKVTFEPVEDEVTRLLRSEVPGDRHEENVLELVRYLERIEGEAHKRGASLSATANVRAQRELLMRTIEDRRLELARLHMPRFVVRRAP